MTRSFSHARGPRNLLEAAWAKKGPQRRAHDILLLRVGTLLTPDRPTLLLLLLLRDERDAMCLGVHRTSSGNRAGADTSHGATRQPAPCYSPRKIPGS